MASSKVLASTALFLSFNILFAAVFVSSQKYPSNGNGNGTGTGTGTGSGNSNSNSNGNGSGNGTGTGIFGLLPGLISIDIGENSGGGNNSNGSSGNSQNSNAPAVGGRKAGNHQGQGQSSGCGTLNLGVCLNLLNLVNLGIGDVPTQPCCTLIQGLANLEVAACLCTDIKADVLGILNINLPVSLSVLLNNCGGNVPANYICNL